MEREALTALEKRVAELRILTAEKSILARSLANEEPIRQHAEISTAILAIAVFVAFLAARAIGIATAPASCAPIAPGTPVSISLRRTDCGFGCPDYEVELTSAGVMSWNGIGGVAHRGRVTRNVPASAVQKLANRMATACFFALADEYLYMGTDHSDAIIVLRVGNRTKRVKYGALDTSVPGTGCVPRGTLAAFERAIGDVAGVDDLVGDLTKHYD